MMKESMTHVRKLITLTGLTILGLAFASTMALAQSRIVDGPVTLQIAAESPSAVPGQTVSLGLYFEIEDHWHLYWLNPGDAGLPPRVRWEHPEGVQIGDLQFPYPELIRYPPLASYGYEYELLLPFSVTVPETAVPGEQIELVANVSWLVCKEECIPGKGTVTFSLPVVAQAEAPNEFWSTKFNDTRFRMPIELPGWSAGVVGTDEAMIVTVVPPSPYTDPLDSIFFFPLTDGLVEAIGTQSITVEDSLFSLSLPRTVANLPVPDTVSGILYNPNGWRGEGSEQALWLTATSDGVTTAGAAATTDSGITIWQAILFAFVGGIILNLMPCVLPVLSLKILGFVQQAGEDRSKILSHGLVFTLGVLVSFWILAGALLILQATGSAIGWGFQLQSPAFLVVLSGFMFLFGLNLLGVFEIGTSMQSVGGQVVGKQGNAGSFLNGVTATVVATPCTAPFMGAALGFALSQPAIVAMGVFTALGLGMAAPYLVLSAFPRLLQFVPKPGAWMESLKQFMGLLLLGTILWLSWVLGLQAGATAVSWLLVGLFVLGLAAWIYGRWGSLARTTAVRRSATALTVLLIAAGLFFSIQNVNVEAKSYQAGLMANPGTTSSNTSGLSWEPFSQSLVTSYLEANSPVFVDFTAAWCISCQVNKRVALKNDDVVAEFERLGVRPVIADWTSRDEMITQALAEFGRNSVPLYVLYDGKGGEPIILPEVLTPGIVLESLERLN